MNNKLHQEFEKWFMEDSKISLNRAKEGHYVYSPDNFGWIIWKAAHAKYSEKDNTNLLDGMLGKRNLHKEHEYLQTIIKLQAYINILREALELLEKASAYSVKEVTEELALPPII